MKKTMLGLLALLMMGCHCQSIRRDACPLSNEPTKPVATQPIPAASSTSQENAVLSTPASVTEKTSLQPKTAQTPVTPAEPASVSRVNTPAANTKPQQAKQPPASTVFTKEQAKEIIAADRAKQTLTKPQPDTAAFSKETLMPTEGRLLSPMAYEPVVADHTNAPWSNESLQYGVYYSFVKAGTAYIKTRGLTNIQGKTAYLIQTTAFSASVIDSVFKVRDINYSWLDANTFHSLGYSQSVREGNYRRDEWVTFDNKNGRFYGEVKKKEQPKAIAGQLDIEVLDMLSSLYYVRQQPLAVGKDVIFDIINREKQYPLVVKVLGKETVKTEAGKFRCWVVEPQFRGEGIFVAKGKSLKVWLTDDEYRMPVKMSVEVFIGSVYAELLEYKRN